MEGTTQQWVKSPSTAKLVLGEMCRQIQAEVYRRVLPTQFTPARSYKIATIKRDLQKLKCEREKEDAKRGYSQLKEILKWDDRFVDVINSLQEARNAEAHPQVTEDNLWTSLAVLDETGELKGTLSPEGITELIAIWKTLKTSHP